MGELLAFSQSALLLLPTSPLRTSRKHHLLTSCSRSSLSVTTPIAHLSKDIFPTSHGGRNQCSWRTVAGLVSDSKVPTTFTVDSAGEGIDILPDSGGSDDSIVGAGGNGGGGGGGNDGNNGGGGNEDESHEKSRGMSISQKLTLGYAALVGIGGAMGYLKGGSQKSLIAGGVSASVLFFVYTMLPTNPFLASSVGLLLSASLLGVMGLRFKKSVKIFPTGIVTFVSLVMTGGYMHGILHGLH
ncbi:protein FATTY ACID EXPORT 2, chloroplastic-like [Salvia splendens]|uniref:protein FATTY ACID EXPORT 2, chloroplastic-like n=1 Tax=Salvia splendens TaxID=180675 RepID=UPI001101102C|nr:protein FATTY ACID EXPORT 2, chloroplastic-like [Salvia splendens]XP_042010483.1 protein FATTY ACID EXPORT 2, chloroplastic-like [Salvia splendens]